MVCSRIVVIILLKTSVSSLAQDLIDVHQVGFLDSYSTDEIFFFFFFTETTKDLKFIMLLLY